VCQTCSNATPCPSGNWCCKGDTCTPAIELTDPANSNNPNNADGTWYGSTFGATTQFQWAASGNVNGPYATDRVYHFDTKNDSVGVEVQIRVWGTFDSVVYLRRGSCGNGGTAIELNDDGCGLGNGGSCITRKLEPGYDWYLYVDGWGTQKGDYTLTMDFTSLCGNCACDSGYGENQTNNPDECYQAGDFCGNYINIPVTGKPQTFYFEDNLGGDHDDFSHYGTYNVHDSCSDCSWCHDHFDKIYRLHLPWSANVILRLEKYGGGWNPNNYPRLFVWQGGTCPGIGDKRICMGGTSDAYQWGSETGVQTFGAGTYWLIADVYYEQGLTSAPYRLRVTVW